VRGSSWEAERGKPELQQEGLVPKVVREQLVQA
jgi:hypothetical protein